MKEPRYAHLLSGEVELDAIEVPARSNSSATGPRVDNERVAVLEEAVEGLRRELDELKAEYAQFRKQFE